MYVHYHAHPRCPLPRPRLLSPVLKHFVMPVDHCLSVQALPLQTPWHLCVLPVRPVARLLPKHCVALPANPRILSPLPSTGHLVQLPTPLGFSESLKPTKPAIPLAD
ncbi:hypothetical protein P3342_010107 [Pyrenophora teres f. teres]|nr:hypothetical protein P3342_010107 [Pyrenophora teres f. teres]